MNSPAIRFAGFTDAWEQRKFGEMYRKVNEKNDMTFGLDRVISVANMYFKRDGYVTDLEYLKTYNVFKLGDIAFEGNRSKNFAHGRFVENTIGDGIVSHVFIVFRPTMKFDLWFWKYAINNERLMGAVLTRSTKSSTMMTDLVVDDFLKNYFLVPCFDEQREIGKFFVELDRLITLHQREHDKSVNIKKALLEKMFPKDGEDKPEIRFAGFTDVWEPRKLGELALSFEYGLNAAATAFDGIHKYIRITDIDDETHEFKFDSLTTPDVNLRLADSYLLKDGDVLFARTGASVGKTYQYMEHDGLVYFAGFLIRARINPKYDSEFVFQNTLTRKYNSFIATTSQRSGQPGVNAVEYADYEILVPKLDEQKAIGIFLSNLDHLITLHKRELTKLQNIKKALLEKMFV